MTGGADPLLTTPAPATPGPEVWADLALRIGTDVGELAADVRDRRHREFFPKAPVYGGAVVDSTGTAVMDLGGPVIGREWEVRGLMVVDANAIGTASGGTPTAASSTFAAGAAGSITLPAGSSVTGFDITTAPVAGAVAGVATVTGLAAGTLSYELAEPVGGGALSIRYPSAMPPLTPATTPQVSVPAIASGAAYAITVYGTTPATGISPGTGFWYTGATPQLATAQTARWPITSLPSFVTKGGEELTVPAHERLFAIVTGCTPGHTIAARADIVNAVPGRMTPVQPV